MSIHYAIGYECNLTGIFRLESLMNGPWVDVFEVANYFYSRLGYFTVRFHVRELRHHSKIDDADLPVVKLRHVEEVSNMDRFLSPL